MSLEMGHSARNLYSHRCLTPQKKASTKKARDSAQNEPLPQKGLHYSKKVSTPTNFMHHKGAFTKKRSYTTTQKCLHQQIVSTTKGHSLQNVFL